MLKPLYDRAFVKFLFAPTFCIADPKSACLGALCPGPPQAWVLLLPEALMCLKALLGALSLPAAGAGALPACQTLDEIWELLPSSFPYL